MMENQFIFLNFLHFTLWMTFFTGTAASDYGVLASETSTDKENFCIIYFKEFSALPNSKSEAAFHPLQDESNIDWCDDHPETEIRSKVLLLTNGNCSISTQARNIYDRGAEGILFITSSNKANSIKVNASTAVGINMSVALISENSAKRLKTMHGVGVCLFAPTKESFDFSLLFIFAMSMLTIIIGSYWSGLIRFALITQEINDVQYRRTQSENDASSESRNAYEESSMNVSPYAVASFVFCMATMLVLLYLFYYYLVYVIIGIFVLASIGAIHGCLEFLVLKIKFNWCKVQIGPSSGRNFNIDFRQVLLISFAIAMALFWVITRKEKYSWILQDLLGVAFCIQVLKTIRLPNFKICTLLLVLLFFYDIFFVFITPFITGTKESIMEEVATGGGKSEEMLPMIFKVPHLGFDPLSVCYQQYSLLGFGDILVPGCVISYCYGFDLLTNKKGIYFATTIITYALGLILTSVSLLYMNTAQPALLYLVPCTLLPPCILAYFLKEFEDLWRGFNIKSVKSLPVLPEVQIEENIPPSEHNDSTNHVIAAHCEKNQLLQ